MAKTTEECYIIGNCFEYGGKTYDCSYAIKRDVKLIIQEAETSHKDSFDELYDRKSLKAGKVRLFFLKTVSFRMAWFYIPYITKRIIMKDVLAEATIRLRMINYFHTYTKRVFVGNKKE